MIKGTRVYANFDKAKKFVLAPRGAAQNVGIQNGASCRQSGFRLITSAQFNGPAEASSGHAA
jgi:hypothetical protein